MHIVPFVASHAQQVILQAAQVRVGAPTAEHARALEMVGGGWSMVDGDRVLACAGMIEQWEGRALAWALLAGDVGRHFPRVHRAVRRALDMAQYRRIEMQVDAEHGPAIRWAQMLGFQVESKMEKFLPDGRDAFMFVRLR